MNAVEGNQRPIDPNQKARQNATSFCGYCRTNGLTPSYRRKKIRDEEVKKLQNEATVEKKVTFTKDFNRRRGPSHGSGNWTNRDGADETRQSSAYTKELSYKGAMMSSRKSDTRGNFRPSTQSYDNSVGTDHSSEGTIRITTATNTMTTEQDRHNSYTEVNLGTGAVTINFHDRLQRRNKTHTSRISADNPDQIHLIFQYLTDLETKIPAKYTLQQEVPDL